MKEIDVGAWGSGPFDNDDAGDWAYELEEAPDAEVVRRALAVADTDYLEAPDGSVAVAAAEVVATAVGRGGPALPDEVAAWVEAHRAHLGPEDAALAAAAIERVLGEGSEARELWDEADDESWAEGTRQLLERLRAG